MYGDVEPAGGPGGEGEGSVTLTTAVYSTSAFMPPKVPETLPKRNLFSSRLPLPGRRGWQRAEPASPGLLVRRAMERGRRSDDVCTAALNPRQERTRVKRAVIRAKPPGGA